MLVELFGELAALKQLAGEQREEIARLKGLKGRPTIKPSGMDQGTGPPRPMSKGKTRFRGKVSPRVSVEDQIVKVAVPEGSRFKGHEPFLVQDLVISARATCYQRERWITSDGQTVLAALPEGVDGHSGPELRRFVLMQYHQGQTTLPRLATLLRSIGVAISKRQLQRLLPDKQVDFVSEARDVLRAGRRCCMEPRLLLARVRPLQADRRPQPKASRAFQTPRRTSSSYPEAALSGDQLAGL